jgi:hypothetical protein
LVFRSELHHWEFHSEECLMRVLVMVKAFRMIPERGCPAFR